MLTSGHSSGAEILTVYNELLDIPTDTFAATSLIRRLIQGVSYDVSAFKCDTQTAYLLVHTSYQIYKFINTCIAKVDEEDENTWDTYNKYIGKIYPLETLLFRLSILAEKDSLSRPDSIDDCVKSFTEWVGSRTEIRAIGETFCAEFPEFLQMSDLNMRIRLDDSTLLSELCHKIEVYNFSINSSVTVGSLISSAKNYAGSILSFMKNLNVISDRMMMLSIRCTMLVFSVMYVSSNSSNNEERVRLMSEAAWRNVVNLLLQLSTFLNNGDNSEAAYITIEIYLSGFVEKIKTETRWEISKAFIDLKKKAGHIGRPFHSQTCQLIEQFQTLYDYHGKKRNSDDVTLLSEAMTAAAVALDSAIIATKDDSISTGKVKNGSVAQAFSAAEGKMKKCFTTFKLGEQWVQHEVAMKTAKKDDVNHAKMFQDKLVAWKDRTYERDSEHITYKLRTRKANDNTFKESIRTAEAKSKLSAILWAESRTNQAIFDYGWHFQHNGLIDDTGEGLIGLNHELKDLPVEDGQATLYLVSI